VYDRAGRGWSDAAVGPQDGAHIAADLYTLLARARVPGPYVVAGHSFGGLYVRSFAAQFPDDVAGMVLLESTAANWARPRHHRPGPTTPSVASPRYACGRPPRSRAPDRPVLPRQSAATLPGRGVRRGVDRPPPRELHRGICSGEHVDTSGVVSDQSQR
jgi:pimeloyl-ACP methyl ester carboxylesterase